MAPRDDSGLYDPRYERDSCGFGLIADLDNRAEPLAWSRPRSPRSRAWPTVAPSPPMATVGDGCGVLLHRPEILPARDRRRSRHPPRAGVHRRHRVPAARRRGSPRTRAACSWPSSSGSRCASPAGAWCRSRARTAARSRWPACRESSRSSSSPPPGIGPGQLPARACSWPGARRKRAGSIPEFYVVSLSATTLGYKGMVLPDALPAVFPDLARAELVSSVVVFHQRFSTNTAPRLEAGAAVPPAGAQRRDQHHRRQPPLGRARAASAGRSPRGRLRRTASRWSRLTGSDSHDAWTTCSRCCWSAAWTCCRRCAS